MRVVVVHTNVVDRRLVLLIDVLHMNRILDAAVAYLRASFGSALVGALWSLAAASEVSALVLEVGVIRELLLWSQISLLRVDIVEHPRIVASGGSRPPHLRVLVCLGPLVDDTRLHQLALALITIELALANFDRHVGNLRFLAL